MAKTKLKKKDYVKSDQHQYYDFYKSKGKAEPKYLAVTARGTPYKYLPILFIMDFPMAPKCVFGCAESGFPV